MIMVNGIPGDCNRVVARGEISLMAKSQEQIDAFIERFGLRDCSSKYHDFDGSSSALLTHWIKESFETIFEVQRHRGIIGFKVILSGMLNVGESLMVTINVPSSCISDSFLIDAFLQAIEPFVQKGSKVEFCKDNTNKFTFVCDKDGNFHREFSCTSLIY